MGVELLSQGGYSSSLEPPKFNFKNKKNKPAVFAGLFSLINTGTARPFFGLFCTAAPYPHTFSDTETPVHLL